MSVESLDRVKSRRGALAPSRLSRAPRLTKSLISWPSCWRVAGEGADLLGDNGKSGALFAGPRRLDRGVEGDEVGAERDVLDGRDQVGDLGSQRCRGWPPPHELTRAASMASPTSCARFAPEAQRRRRTAPEAGIERRPERRLSSRTSRPRRAVAPPWRDGGRPVRRCARSLVSSRARRSSSSSRPDDRLRSEPHSARPARRRRRCGHVLPEAPVRRRRAPRRSGQSPAASPAIRARSGSQPGRAPPGAFQVRHPPFRRASPRQSPRSWHRSSPFREASATPRSAHFRPVRERRGTACRRSPDPFALCLETGKIGKGRATRKRMVQRAKSCAGNGNFSRLRQERHRNWRLRQPGRTALARLSC